MATVTSERDMLDGLLGDVEQIRERAPLLPRLPHGARPWRGGSSSSRSRRPQRGSYRRRASIGPARQLAPGSSLNTSAAWTSSRRSCAAREDWTSDTFA
jgi:hypothetical protein